MSLVSFFFGTQCIIICSYLLKGVINGNNINIIIFYSLSNECTNLELRVCRGIESHFAKDVPYNRSVELTVLYVRLDVYFISVSCKFGKISTKQRQKYERENIIKHLKVITGLKMSFCIPLCD